MRRDAVLGADSFDRGVEVIENRVGNRRGDFAGVAADVNRLAGDDAASGLLHRAQHRVEVEWHERAEVNDLGADAFLGLQFVRRLQAVVDSMNMIGLLSRMADFNMPFAS